MNQNEGSASPTYKVSHLSASDARPASFHLARSGLAKLTRGLGAHWRLIKCLSFESVNRLGNSEAAA